MSGDRDASLHSLSAQISHYSDYIQRHRDWEYAGVYTDEGVTGTRDSRLGFQRLLRDCRAGRIDIVLTKSISRFAHNTVDLLEKVRELKQLGVDVYFERENICSMSGDGELLLTILASFAQEESRSVSENCKWRIRDKFKKGIPTFCRIYGFRFRNNSFEIVPREAKVIQMIFADYLGGMGKGAIAKKLNDAGIAAYSGGDWTFNVIDEILRNEKYVGNLLLQKTFIADHLTKKQEKNIGQLPKYLVEGNHDAIISKETYKATQMEIDRRARLFKRTRTAPKKSPFTSKIKCGKCGASFRRKSSNAITKYKSMGWACATWNRFGKAKCAAKQIPEDILKEVCAKVLGMSKFNEGVFAAKVDLIIVPENGKLLFNMHDGSRATMAWENKSRCDSWTDEMKQAARERQFKILERGHGK